MRAVSSRSPGTLRAPSAALTRIGHNAPKQITTIFIWSPIPISRMPTGMIADGGIARKNCKNGSSSRNSGRYAPMITKRFETEQENVRWLLVLKRATR